MKIYLDIIGNHQNQFSKFPEKEKNENLFGHYQSQFSKIPEKEKNENLSGLGLASLKIFPTSLRLILNWIQIFRKVIVESETIRVL